MINAGIVGGTGYTGVDLLRLLIAHPMVTVAAVTSRSDAGTRLRRCLLRNTQWDSDAHGPGSPRSGHPGD